MRFLRFLCNTLMFFAVLITVSIVQITLFNITSLQSKDVEPIHISTSEEDEISYFDSYAFWAQDIGVNMKEGPKYRVRNWFNWKWWKKGMAWADYAVDAVIASTKPIFVPIAQVNAVKNYYGYSINDFDSYHLQYYSEEELNNALYEVYVIFDEGYEQAYTVGEEKIEIEKYHYTGKIELTDDIDIKVEYARWVKRHKRLFNTIWKLEKYNMEGYGEKYFKKFISYEIQENPDGSIEYVNRHIKTPVVVMYYHQYVSIIIALIFVIKFPITFFQGRVVGRKGKNGEEVVGH